MWFSKENKRLLAFSVASAAVLLSACDNSSSDPESSSDFATNSIRAEYSVVVTDAGDGKHDYRMEARFEHDSDSLKLEGGDTISVVNGEQRYSLTENEVLGTVIYSHTENIANNVKPSELIFSLERDSQEDADASVINIPAYVEALQPTSDETISLLLGKYILVWTANESDSAGMTITQRYRCSTQAAGLVLDRTAEITTEDDGQYVLDIQAVIGDEDYDRGCTMDLTFSRKREGRLDEALKSGLTDGYYQEVVSDVRFEP
ncbi:hypothetical protein [Bacterioplanoides sp. SCSIO 12839]|uniref:hypothetical protein n=1 Tax=Bacterioplanoides sp. SCSIO 12839 TaxID=2829569 RepID=UPI002103F584|nr:hypothetical protein [Bacterioplanoides sp. SCSIO 12839]UTW47156.1 hypothetical protein KFF03_11225 [Bacterioplanoides sp. SCSIO 12839]